MQTLTKVGGPNVANDTTFTSFTCATANVRMEISCASYDTFGRLSNLVRPGDTFSAVTLNANYYDYERPMRYQVGQRMTMASGVQYSTSIHYYDGLGRKIQDKRESEGWGTRMVVGVVTPNVIGNCAPGQCQARFAQ